MKHFMTQDIFISSALIYEFLHSAQAVPEFKILIVRPQKNISKPILLIFKIYVNSYKQINVSNFF